MHYRYPDIFITLRIFKQKKAESNDSAFFIKTYISY